MELAEAAGVFDFAKHWLGDVFAAPVDGLALLGLELALHPLFDVEVFRDLPFGRPALDVAFAFTDHDVRIDSTVGEAGDVVLGVVASVGWQGSVRFSV